MSIAFQAMTPVNSGTAAGATVDFTGLGPASRQILVLVLGFEGVAAATGPYVQLDPGIVFGGITAGSGWDRVITQAPSASGNGLEVWAAIWTSGVAPVKFWFGGSNLTYVARALIYSGEFDPGGTNPFPVQTGVVRSATSAQVTGNNPAAPSVYSFVGEELIAVGADQLASPGFGTPTPAGWTKRFDSERAATFGNVEITAADKATVLEGSTGSIPWSATAATGTTKGATATIAIRSTDSNSGPVPTIGSTSPLISLEYA